MFIKYSSNICHPILIHIRVVSVFGPPAGSPTDGRPPSGSWTCPERHDWFHKGRPGASTGQGRLGAPWEAKGWMEMEPCFLIFLVSLNIFWQSKCRFLAWNPLLSSPICDPATQRLVTGRVPLLAGKIITKSDCTKPIRHPHCRLRNDAPNWVPDGSRVASLSSLSVLDQVEPAWTNLHLPTPWLPAASKGEETCSVSKRVRADMIRT